MMSTERTAIRRRLAIGRWTHGPPRSLRKPGHRSIVAPLAATLAAGLAVGLGIALAKAGSERRSGKHRRAARRLGLLRGERPAEGLRRMLLAQADLALEELGSERRTDDGGERAVHETRKAIKRLRALLRLLECDLGAEVCDREHAVLRRVARELAGARDAQVMLQTLEGLLARHPKRLGARRGVRRLRKSLEADLGRARRSTLDDPAGRARAVRELRTFRARASTWELERPGRRTAELGLRAIYEKGARRQRRAARGKRPNAKRMHAWRKRVKDLRYAAEALAPQAAREHPGHSKRRLKAARKSRKRLRQLARDAAELGELLGEEHDLAVLADKIAKRPAGSAASVRIGKDTRRELLRLIEKRRRKLRRNALRKGRSLYRRPAKDAVRRLRPARD